MYAAPQQNVLPPSFDVASCFFESKAVCLSGMREQEAPYCASRMINSVVSEAGLGRFVYLRGQSGKRFVFSSITREQAGLYNHAVFAVSRPGEDTVHIGGCVDDVCSFGTMLYVHLLDEVDEQAETVLRDLGETSKQ